MKRATLTALLVLGGCVVPAELPSLEATPAAAPSTLSADPISLGQLALIAETSDGSHGCSSGDLATYAVPGGLVRRLAVAALWGGVTSILDAAVFYPRTVVEGSRWRTIIERIDLRTATTTLRIDADAGAFGNGLYPEPRCHAVLDLSADGSTLALARPGYEGLPARVRVDLFDARSGRHLVTRSFDARAGSADVRLRVVARDRIFLTLDALGGCGGGSCSANLGVDHLVLDGQLTQVGSAEFACGRAQPAASGRAIAVCGSTVRSFKPSGEPDRAVAIPKGPAELLLGWRTTDQHAVLITERQLIRVNLVAMELTDARPIQHAVSLRSPFGPQVALAKMAPPRPAVQISSDGQTAYVIPWPAASSRPGISVIDAATATVRARYLTDREIWGIQLSADGSRLFALDGDGYASGAAKLVVLDSASGAVLSTVTLERPALALVGAGP